MVDSTTVMDLQTSLPVHSGDIHCLAVHKDVIVTTSGSSLIRVFNAADYTEKSYSPLQIHKYHVIHCVLTSDGKRLVSMSMDGKASVVDTDTGKLLAYHQQPNDVGMRAGCLSSYDHMAAFGACDGTIAVMEMDTYKTLKTMSVNDDETILALCFTPDTHWLLSGHSVTGDIRVWNAQYLVSKPAAVQMTAHELGTHYLQISPKYTGKPGECNQGVQFASAGADCMVCLWSITYPGDDSTPPRLSKLNTLVGHTGPVYCVKYSSSGETLASCGGDFTVRLWNLEGECIYVHVEAHTSFINSLAFSADDLQIYTASCDRTVKVWAVTDTFHLKDAPRCSNGGLPEPTPQTTRTVTYAAASQPVVQKKSLSTDVAYWSVDDVCHWLSGLGLSKYTDIFRRHDIDGCELKQLTKEILEHDIGIGAYGARNKIMRALDELLTKKTTARVAEPSPHNLAHEFICPITHEIMKEPVVASDGYSYERQAIDSWMAAGKTTSPMTNAVLAVNTILPNYNLKILIDKQHSTN